MPSTQIDVKGTISWAKVFESNRDRADWNVKQTVNTKSQSLQTRRQQML